jgi:hypothetical protein
MVSDGKITQAQSDSYLNWVNQYLQSIGQGNSRMMPGFGRNFPGGFRRNLPAAPGASAAPQSTVAPAAATGSGV